MIVDRDLLRGDRRPLIASLWVFVLLNVLFRDLHELFRPGLLEQMISGTVNGTVTTEVVVLMGGVLIEVPLLMVVVSRVLVPRLARVVNGVLAPVVAPLLLVGGLRDLDDVFFAAVEVLALAAIATLAWTWRPASGAPAAVAVPAAAAR